VFGKILEPIDNEYCKAVSSNFKFIADFATSVSDLIEKISFRRILVDSYKVLYDSNLLILEPKTLFVLFKLSTLLAICC